MKEKFYAFCWFASCVGFLFSSCQKEESVLIDETPIDTITANSMLGTMLLSASQNNGAVDDLIDSTSCFSLNFPITVYANSQIVSLQSIADIQTIVLIFNQSQTDVDMIDIVFPIEIVYEDYSVHTINSLQEMSVAQTDCPDFIDDTYSCVSFLYPISCFTYNAESEQTGLVTMNNDSEWFEYLAYLSDDIFIAIDYDMSILVNGETSTVTSNQELATALAATDCGEDTSAVHTEVTILRTIMKEGTWYISQFLNNGIDQTYGYLGFYLDFRDSITVFAYEGSNVIGGTWIVTYQNDAVNFALNMEDSLSGLNNDAYEVFSQTENELTFVSRDSSGEIQDTLMLTQN
jgi:type 1 glutamine amidotransferase